MNPNVFTLIIFLLGQAVLAAGIFAQLSNFEAIPLKLAGNFICVEGAADGQAGNFIIDTGIRGIVLNSRYFEGENTNRMLHGINGHEEEAEARYTTLCLGNIAFPLTYAFIANLNSIEKKAHGIEAIGLIGVDVFMDYEIAFDFANGELLLCKLDRKGGKAALSLSYPPPSDTIEMEFKGHLPCIKAQVGGQTLCLAIDSGSEANILHQNNIQKILPYLKAQRKAKIAGWGQEAQPTTIGMLTGMELGSTPYLPMLTAIKNIGYFNASLPGPRLDGILGFCFLRQYKTAINFKKKELYIWNEGQRAREVPAEEMIVVNH
ncbi:MAG: hypothetical protein KDD06_28565 [Phaeodactylibacter sp.]|nr:hypothetical protein [Phaeodactylibacter sp.]